MTVSAGTLSLIWLAVLFVCIVIEVATMGLTTIWFAGGALVSAILAMLKAPLWAQVTAFFVVSIVLLIFTRPVAMRYFNKSRAKTNIDSVIGKEAIVISEIDNLQGIGRVQVDGKEWTARTLTNGVTIPVGAVVIVNKVDGVKLIVEERKEEV
ncbi:MAG: NfeD family protein [Lachnospiraceae bacterium]|nr:NfeD family protein [Lachnospiraceae bacterium]